LSDVPPVDATTQARPSSEGAEGLADADLTKLISTLDARIGAGPTLPEGARDPRLTFWDFARGLQAARLSTAQEERALARLDAIERARPDVAEYSRRAGEMVRALTVGKRAPEIVGTDLDGEPLKLSDYRGKVVVLAFSADWCGICRAEYPYLRLLLDLYGNGNWPFAILGVDNSQDLNAAKGVKIDQRLPYRSWWDGGGDDLAGPIAGAWNVQGWPTLYLLDGDGIIRYVDLKDEQLVKAVRELLNEKRTESGTRPDSDH
jgi:thiol-disulfide isomerase/thioredoxin